MQKRFTNGHKVFTAMEAKQMNEQQRRERETQLQFEENFHKLHRDRNPLSGGRDSALRGVLQRKRCRSTHLLSQIDLLPRKGHLQRRSL